MQKIKIKDKKNDNHNSPMLDNRHNDENDVDDVDDDGKSLATDNNDKQIKQKQVWRRRVTVHLNKFLPFDNKIRIK